MIKGLKGNFSKLKNNNFYCAAKTKLKNQKLFTLQMITEMFYWC